MTSEIFSVVLKIKCNFVTLDNYCLSSGVDWNMIQSLLLSHAHAAYMYNS